jgi:hypothetical protein
MQDAADSGDILNTKILKIKCFLILLTRIPSGMHDVTIEQQYVKRT